MEAYSAVHAQAEASAEARRRIERAAREHGILLAGLRLRLRLTMPDRPGDGPVLAQANAHADGHPVRVQVLAPTVEQAVEALCARAEARLTATLHGWQPRSRPEPDRQLPNAVAGLEPKIARIKNCVLAVCTPEVAAAYMDAMDYDAHLFTDRDSGQTCAVSGSGPTGYRLAWLRLPLPPRHPRPPLVIDSHPAPVLSATGATARLNQTGDGHLFFAEPTTGRGHLIYRRYDGHYALVTGDPVPQPTAKPDVGREARFRVLTGSWG